MGLVGNPKPPIGITSRIFYGWYIVAAGAFIQLWVSTVWIYGMQIFFTPIIEAFGWSRAIVSGAFALQRLEGSIASPIEGILVDKIGPRKIVMAGGLLMGLGLISLYFLQTVWMFYGSVLVVSLGLSCMVGIPRTWAVVQWFRRLRGRALGIGSAGPVISGPLLIIIVWLISLVGWRVAFLVLGLSTWIVCIPLGLVFRGRPQDYGLLPDGESVESEQSLKVGTPNDNLDRSLDVRSALKTPVFWTLTMVFGAQTMGVSGLMIHMIPYFESIGFSTARATSVLAIYTILSAIGRLGGGWAMDYFEKRLVLAVLLGSQAVSLLILANITVFWQAIPFALFYGIAFGGMIPSRGAIISGYFGTRNFGTLQGLSQSATVLGGMVGPVLMGWVFDVSGSYLLSVQIIMVITALAIPIAFLAKPPR